MTHEYTTARGNPLVQYATARAASVVLGVPAVRIAAERYGASALSTRALLASISSGGGALVPVDLGAEIISSLKAIPVVRRNVPQKNSVSLPHGNLTIGRASSVPSAGFIGEDAATDASANPTFGDINFQAKKAIATLPISNDLLRFSHPGIEEVISSQLLAQYASAEDKFFLTGTGSQYSPKGLRWSATTVNDATADYSVATVISDLTGIINALETANVPRTAPWCWFTSPQVLDYLRSAVSSSGQFMFPGIQRGELMGFPIESSTSISQTLGESSNQSELYLCAMSEAIVAQGFVEVTVRHNATYHDTSGNLVSGFDRDKFVVKFLSAVDFGLKHSQACAVLTNVPWAA